MIILGFIHFSSTSFLRLQSYFPFFIIVLYLSRIMHIYTYSSECKLHTFSVASDEATFALPSQAPSLLFIGNLWFNRLRWPANSLSQACSPRAFGSDSPVSRFCGWISAYGRLCLRLFSAASSFLSNRIFLPMMPLRIVPSGLPPRAAFLFALTNLLYKYRIYLPLQL